jgi:uncharacterized protein YbbC (DUF1343 family)/CubicO group peptidase (beta-lactamase class C family)
VTFMNAFGPKINLSRLLFSLSMACFFLGPLVAARSLAVAGASYPSDLRKEQLMPIDDLVEREIRSGKIPGAVVLIGNADNVLYRKAFGYRSLVDDKLPMTKDTIFDLASLTKVVATTTAVMQLVERGKMGLDDAVAKYWPMFTGDGKKRITIRELLTHYSGLRPDLSHKSEWSGYETALHKILAEKPVCPPGKRFIYSDINFQILGELVRRISGKPLDVYTEENIFKPLGMNHTSFRPSPALRHMIAPTECLNGKNGKMLHGEVHDPTAYRMGGVAGHAGLFSTADDLAILATMLLNFGSHNDIRILSRLSVENMTKKQTPSNGALRGLGWNIYSPFTGKRGIHLPAGFYGHTGYTGTSLWIDAVSKTYVIILTSRVHPDGRGDAGPLRRQIAALVTRSLDPLFAGDNGDKSGFSGSGSDDTKRVGMDGFRKVTLQTGIDVLESEKFAPLAGLRVGLITNHSGLNSQGVRTLDILYKAQGVKLAALFSPEHGLSGKVDTKVPMVTDSSTGLPVYSLYGDVKRPTDMMLDGLDALVFDVQDIGVRFYTYITTMGYAMEIAAGRGIPFYVLDRPNPINASMVQGPVMKEEMKSFTGYFPLPVRHGMTVGELAEMFNSENRIGSDLHIIKMRGYERHRWYDETGLQWVNPSPNIRSLTQAILYPGVALAEGANLSVGRGTEMPFEVFGAPWVDAKKLASYLNKRRIQGVSFTPVRFTPVSSSYKDKVCNGIRISLDNRRVLDSAVMGLEIVYALYRLFPEKFLIDKTLGLIGDRLVLQSLKEGKDVRLIALQWQDSLDTFRRLRSKYLLY